MKRRNIAFLVLFALFNLFINNIVFSQPQQNYYITTTIVNCPSFFSLNNPGSCSLEINGEYSSLYSSSYSYSNNPEYIKFNNPGDLVNFLNNTNKANAPNAITCPYPYLGSIGSDYYFVPNPSSQIGGSSCLFESNGNIEINNKVKVRSYIYWHATAPATMTFPSFSLSGFGSKSSASSTKIYGFAVQNINNYVPAYISNSSYIFQMPPGMQQYLVWAII